jgi:hypothetical protein
MLEDFGSCHDSTNSHPIACRRSSIPRIRARRTSVAVDDRGAVIARPNHSVGLSDYHNISTT